MAAGLNCGCWGSLSIRLSDAEMLVTPSGRDLAAIDPDQIVTVSISNLKYEAFAQAPTTERRIHAAIYKQRSDVGAIIISHSKYSSVFAASCMPLEVENPALSENIGNLIHVSDFAHHGTFTEARSVARAMGSGCGCIIAHHGMVAVGIDMKQAFHRCCDIEEAARQYVESRRIVSQ